MAITSAVTLTGESLRRSGQGHRWGTQEGWTSALREEGSSYMECGMWDVECGEASISPKSSE